MSPRLDLIAALEDQLARAIEREDFEVAKILRDRLAVLGGDEAEGSYLRRQEPGRMGLGTSQEVPRKPEGWKPPKKPDPMTKGHVPRRG
jgi:hypothetical protein